MRIVALRLVTRKAKRLDDEMTIRGISVLLTPDPMQRQAPVAASDRRQILDGIVQYGDMLVVAIENKILSGVTASQPSAINTNGAPVEFDKQVRTVAWQELLEAYADMSIRGLVAGSERHVIDDFLEFAEHFFPQVGPYSTLRRAEKSRARMGRRLDTVLASAIGVEEMSRQELGCRHLPVRDDGRPRSVGRIASTKSVPRAKWNAEWASLEALGIVQQEDRAEFDLRFTRTKIETAGPRPGLACEFSWNLDEAMRLDDAGLFIAGVREVVTRFLQQLGEPLPLTLPMAECEKAA